ncbi:MAG: formate dehydrogenase subunit gamma [Bacillota bacterium]
MTEATTHTEPHEARPASYQRWNLQHRLQHGVLALSTMGLLWTGLAIKFHYVGWAQWTFRLFGGFHGNLIAHKVCASALVFVSIWHLIYLLVGWRKMGISWGMVPTLNDLRDSYHHMLFLLNLRKTPPQYDRYTYLEKFEYLAIFWGMFVMGGTGFALWFPTWAANWVPRTWLDGFRIVHGNEAIVAVITLAYGHFFNAHFNPAVFPSNPVWLTGRISLEHMLEEHPLEYQRLVEKGVLPAPAHAEHHEPSLAGWRRWVAGIELIIYSAIFYYLLVTFIPMLLA